MTTRRPGSPSPGTVVELGTAQPFAAAPLLAALAAHHVPGLDETDVSARTHTRLLTVAGETVPVTVHLADDAVRLELPGGHRRTPAGLVRTVRQWFDLDAVPDQVVAVLGGDPVLGPLVRLRPGLRVLGHPAGFEAAVLTVLGQQVSVGAGRTFAARAVAAYGAPGPAGLRSFPAPEQLAGQDPDDLRRTLGLTGARARCLHALATACAEGLRIAPDVDHTELRRRLRGVPGIGPWTVENLAVRAFGDRDAFPSGDLVLRRALGAGSSAAADRRAAAWSPLRAYAAFHLWTAAVYAAVPSPDVASGERRPLSVP